MEFENNKIKIIFLDFDGVITTGKNKWRLDPSKLELLKQIIDSDDNIKLVISSSWRQNTLEDTLRFLVDCERNKYLDNIKFPFIDKIIGITERLRPKKYSYMDETRRGKEIKKYLEDNNLLNVPYVILDDIPQFLEEQMSHYIWTDWEYGLSNKDVKEAIKILNN